MSTIKSSTTSTTAFSVVADTTGTLVFQTGATPTTAVTIGSDQSATFAGAVNTTGNQTITGSLTTTGYANLPNTFGFKNRIINGAMMIDQRNAGASVTPSTGGTYTLDRFACGMSQASKYSVQQTPSATETGYATRVAAGFTNYLAVTSLAATSLGASDYFTQTQIIEGLNVADLGWGTASAKTITLSFWIRSSLTGTFGGALQNSAQDRHYPFSYTISSANTWEQKSITIAGDTTGTWLTTSGIGIRVVWGLGVGSTYSGIAGAWTGTYALSCTGATSVVSTNGATFYITGVQLEKGSTATSFDYRPYGTELMLCQRYYYKSPGLENFFQYQAGASSTGIGGTTCFPVTMRATPTMTYGSSTPYSGNTFNRVDTGVDVTFTLTQNLTTASRTGSIYDNTLTSGNLGVLWKTYLTASAEL